MILIALFLVLLSGPVYANEFTIDEAYIAAKNDRTKFDAEITNIPKADAKYLDHFFFVSDVAMRARVMTLHHFMGYQDSMSLEDYDMEIENVIQSFEFAKTPPNLQQPQDLLVQAIRDQQKFFHKWAKLQPGSEAYELMKKRYNRSRDIKKAQGKLKQVYYLLKSQYSDETGYNLKAFNDHLTGLHFFRKL